MKQDTLKITTGGMFVALFAIILIINRQTGMMFEELIFYILPIPMVAYSAKWGFKTSLPVLAAMALISFFFGTITTIFYAVSEACIGLVLGTRIYHKKDVTRTILIVTGLSVVANLLNTVVFASLFGYDLMQIANQTRDAMITSYQQAAEITGNDLSEMITQMENLLTPSYLMSAIVFSMALLGAIQGLAVYYISIMILRRLRFQIPKPGNLGDVCPPAWTGYLAFLSTMGYSLAATRITDTRLVRGAQVVGMCGAYYLLFFGFMGVMLLVNNYVSRKRGVKILIATMALFCAFFAVMCVGFFYISTDWHRKIVERKKNPDAESKEKEKGPFDVKQPAAANRSYVSGTEGYKIQGNWRELAARNQATEEDENDQEEQ